MATQNERKTSVLSNEAKKRDDKPIYTRFTDEVFELINMSLSKVMNKL